MIPKSTAVLVGIALWLMGVWLGVDIAGGWDCVAESCVPEVTP